MKASMPWRRNGGLREPLRHEMEDLFQRFFEPLEKFPVAQPWAPRVDVSETEQEVFVKADLPGVEPQDVEVTVAEGALIVRGEKKVEKEEQKTNYYRTERFVGQFYREVPLPVGADPEKITAAYAKGVVTITIPKKPEVQPKKIPVKPLE